MSLSYDHLDHVIEVFARTSSKLMNGDSVLEDLTEDERIELAMGGLLGVARGYLKSSKSKELSTNAEAFALLIEQRITDVE